MLNLMLIYRIFRGKYLSVYLELLSEYHYYDKSVSLYMVAGFIV